ncbi:MAG: hypothetical protein JW829_03415 [Pirellulales bacterium]|nr:hypothetical protein [Pirellulales bacterium]
MAGWWPIGDIPISLVVKSLLGLACILLLVSAGILVIRWARTQTKDGIVTSTEILTQFRELHANGRLSDDEFQSIRSQLISQLQSEMKKDDKPG